MITFSLTWTLTFGVFISMIILTWDAMFNYAGPMWNDLVVTWNYDELFGRIQFPYITPAPSWTDAFKLSSLVAITMLSLAILMFWLEPIKRALIPMGKCERVGKEQPLYQFVVDICDKAGVKSTPNIYVMDSPQKNAFAVSKPFRSVIVVSQPLLSIENNELAWVIAHELGHIHYGDSKSSALWMSIIRVERLALHLRYLFLRITYPILMRIPPLRLLSTPILWMLNITVYMSDLTSSMTHKLFRILDSYAQRQMEYRADQYASQIVPIHHGISILQKLGGMVEPTFDIFATHPPMQKRIERLQR